MSGVDDLEEGWFKDLMLRPTSRREFLKKLGKTGAALVGTKLLTSCGANAPPVEILPDTTSDDAMTIARSAYNLAKTFVDEPVLSGIQGLPTGQEMYDWLINAAKIHPEYYSRHKHPDSKIHIDERLMLDLSFIQAYFSADDFSQWKNDFTPFGIDLANEHVPKGVISRYKSVWEIYKTSFLKDCVEGKNTNGVINPQSFTALKEIREAANMFKTEVGTSILDKGTLEAIADQLPTDIRQGGIDLPLGVFDDVHIRFLIAHISEMYRLEHDVIEIEKQIENIIYGEETAVGKVPGIVDIWNSMAFTGKTISGEYAEFVKHADAFTNYYNNLDIGEKVKIKTNIGVSEEHKEKWEKGWPVKFQEVIVDTITVKEMFEEFGTNFSFINLDVEGCSWELFESFDLNILPELKLLCIEHDSCIEDIKKKCNPFGFVELDRNGENLILGR